MKVNLKKKIRLNNLPTPLSTFVGRERELADVRRLLSAHRLVTLTGAGGSGKTRLALKAAQSLTEYFEDRVWFIELASVTDPALVPQSIAATLNVREQSGRPLIEILVDILSTSPALLVIDNCEHLILACAQVIEALLKKCSDLKILATSREIVGITGEVAWMVPPLSLPGQQPWTNPASGQEAVRYYEEFESVQLFVARARTVYPAFQLTAENGPWVAEICRRLDGVPLAIELAAARARSLSVQQIAQRLDDRFHLLTGGSRTAAPRQQTLAATLDWSYALLSEAEQGVLQCLSVFAGGATLDAAEVVCAGERVGPVEVLNALSHLVDKSLVMMDRPERGETRYRLLETIRQYAHEKLIDSGDEEKAKNLHLNYFIQWAEMVESHLDKPEQLVWLELYETEHDNLRAALEWCQADKRRALSGLRLAAACGRFWRLRGYLSEGRKHLSAALAQADAHERTITRARALTFLANHAYLQSDYPAMRPVAAEALSIWRELGQAGRAGTAATLDLLGELATEEGDYQNAPRLFEEALSIFQELKDTRGTGDMLMQLGWAAMRTGDYEQAATRMEESLALFQKVNNPALTAFALAGLGELAVRQEQYERAVRLLKESLELRRMHGHKWGMGTSLGSLGWVALRQRDFKQMRKWLDESLAVRIEIGDKGGIAWCLEKLAESQYDQAQFQNATKIFGHAEALRTPIGSVIDPADQSEYHRIISDLRATLGQDAFAVHWAEGAAMQLERIMDLALCEPEPSPDTTPRAEKEKFGGLTAREREVAKLIAQGKSNRQIAEAMTVGLKTVETYVTRILNKLGYASRVHIATWATEKGLAPPARDRE